MGHQGAESKWIHTSPLTQVEGAIPCMHRHNHYLLTCTRGYTIMYYILNSHEHASLGVSKHHRVSRRALILSIPQAYGRIKTDRIEPLNYPMTWGNTLVRCFRTFEKVLTNYIKSPHEGAIYEHLLLVIISQAVQGDIFYSFVESYTHMC